MTLLINAREFFKRLGSWDKKCLHAVNKACPCELWRTPMIIRAIWVIRLNLPTTATSGPGSWDTTHMKGVGMLVVLLSGGGGGDFGFWSHLGCSWAKRHHYLAVKVSFRVEREKIWKYIFDMDIFNTFYLLHSYNPSFLNSSSFKFSSYITYHLRLVPRETVNFVSRESQCFPWFPLGKHWYSRETKLTVSRGTSPQVFNVIKKDRCGEVVINGGSTVDYLAIKWEKMRKLLRSSMG